MLTKEQKKMYAELTDMQRNFCDAKIKGMSNGDAHNYACDQLGKPRSVQAHKAGFAYLNHKKVSDFIEGVLHDMHNRIAKNAIMSREEAILTLSKIARGKVPAKFRRIEIVDAHGDTRHQTIVELPDSDDLTDEQLSTIAEVSQSRDGIKIKQHCPVNAINQLSKLEGWNKEKEDVGKEIHIHIDGKLAKF